MAWEQVTQLLLGYKSKYTNYLELQIYFRSPEGLRTGTTSYLWAALLANAKFYRHKFCIRYCPVELTFNDMLNIPICCKASVGIIHPIC
jgi:hypothetical protein